MRRMAAAQLGEEVLLLMHIHSCQHGVKPTKTGHSDSWRKLCPVA